MKRDTESSFFETLSISKRGMVKTAASMLPDGKEAVLSAQDVEKALRAFDKSPDVSKSTLSSFRERAKIDLNPKSVVEDFFGILVAQRNNMQKMSIVTAMSYRQAGIFKVAGRDVYEDLETGDFWKISEDKKHVMRLFKENEDGISDKRAAKKQQYSIMGGPGDGGDQYDDYQVKLIKSAGVEPGVPDGTGPNPDCPCKKKDVEDSKEATTENFEDSVDFTDELDKAGSHISKLLELVKKSKWLQWMKITDENYSTNCTGSFKEFLSKLESLNQSFNDLGNEIDKAK